MKTDLTKLLEIGAINLFELKEKGSDIYLLTVNETEEPYEIILKKEEGAGYMAYIPTSIPMTKYSQLATIVTELFESGVYSGMFSYVPMRNDIILSTEEKKIINIVKPKVGNKLDGIEKIVEKLGYTFEEEDFSYKLKNKRDYSLIMAENPELQERFNEDDAEIKALSASFDNLSDEFKDVYKVIENGSCLGALISGPTGVGKSYAINLMANKLKAPKLVLGITYGTSIDDLLGSYAPKDKNDVSLTAIQGEMKMLWSELTHKKVDVTDAAAFNREAEIISQKIHQLMEESGGSAKWVFKPGPLLMAYKDGYVFQGDEINFGQPGILALLNTFTDFNSHVVVMGEVVKRHNNFVCFLTFNPGYKGTDVLNIALKNRFGIINVPELTKSEYSKRMIGYSKMRGHAFSEKFYNEVFEYANFIEKTSASFHEDVKFSVRNAQRLTDMALSEKMNYNSFEAAIHVQFTNALSCDNDNCRKLQDFKKDATTVSAIKKIYDLYDYSEPTVVKFKPIDLNDFINTKTGSSETGHKGSSSDAEFDDLLKGLGL